VGFGSPFLFLGFGNLWKFDVELATPNDFREANPAFRYYQG